MAFKVGDKVKYIGNEYPDILPTGTITNVYVSNGNYIAVSPAGWATAGVYVRKADLELIDASSATTPKFKVGDRVSYPVDADIYVIVAVHSHKSYDVTIENKNYIYRYQDLEKIGYQLLSNAKTTSTLEVGDLVEYIPDKSVTKITKKVYSYYTGDYEFELAAVQGWVPRKDLRSMSIPGLSNANPTSVSGIASGAGLSYASVYGNAAIYGKGETKVSWENEITKTTTKCDCGAFKAHGAAVTEFDHSSWCSALGKKA